MNVKAQVRKIAAPILSANGYHLVDPERAESVFMSEDSSHAIAFDIGSFMPRKLRVCYNAYKNNSFNLQLQYFYPEFCPASILSYETQEELGLYLEQVVSSSLKIVFPFIIAMMDNYVLSTNEMKVALSHQTGDRAARFAKAHGLSPHPTRENLVKLDEIMDGWKSDVHCRKAEFMQHEDEIIDLSAYFGQLIAEKEEVPGKWAWIEINPGTSSYVAGDSCYNALGRVISAWNFGSEVMNYSFKRFPL